MPIPAAKVKAICTSSEAALVRASRSPVLETLSAADLKKHSVQARKQFDKWQGLARGQARSHQRQSGVSKTDANTQLKEQIFREALDAFEARLAKSTAAPAKAKATSSNSKQQRAGEHRATRADVRKTLTTVEAKLNVPAPPVKKVAPAKLAAPAPTVEATTAPPAASARRKPVVKPAAKKLRPKKPVPSAMLPVALTKMPAGKQRAAVTAAKQSRIVRSGKAGRMVGHTMARGKRSQARRDSKG